MDTQQLEQARLELMARFPNFSTLLSFFKGRFVPTPGKGTIAVDRHMRVYFDPALTWSHDEILGAMEHEMGHICRSHFDRAKMFEELTGQKVSVMKWNIAGDLEINDDLVFELPAGYGVRPGVAPFDHLREGGIAEGYYAKLFPPKPEPEDDEEEDEDEHDTDDEQEGDEDGSGGEGACDEDGTEEGDEGAGDSEGDEEGDDAGSGGEGSDEQVESDAEGSGGADGGDGGAEAGGTAGPGGPGGGEGEADTDAEGQGGQDGEPGDAESYEGHEGDCGSCAGGPAREDELPIDDDQYPGVTEDQVDRAVDEAKKATGRMMAEVEPGGHLAGSTAPGEGSAMAESVFGPAMTDVYSSVWEQVMHREVSRYLKSGGSGYQRPSRRLYDRKLIYMGKHKVPPKVAIVVDTSGSIDEAAAHRAFAICSKFKGWNIQIRVVACDTRAREVQPGQSGYSGGGTNMGAGIEYVRKNFGKVDVCFVVTDAENLATEWGNPPYPFPVVVMSWRYDGPEWARTVRMPPLDESQAGSRPVGKMYRY